MCSGMVNSEAFCSATLWKCSIKQKKLQPKTEKIQRLFCIWLCRGQCKPFLPPSVRSSCHTGCGCMEQSSPVVVLLEGQSCWHDKCVGGWEGKESQADDDLYHSLWMVIVGQQSTCEDDRLEWQKWREQGLTEDNRWQRIHLQDRLEKMCCHRWKFSLKGVITLHFVALWLNPSTWPTGDQEAASVLHWLCLILASLTYSSVSWKWQKISINSKITQASLCTCTHSCERRGSTWWRCPHSWHGIKLAPLSWWSHLKTSFHVLQHEIRDKFWADWVVFSEGTDWVEFGWF